MSKAGGSVKVFLKILIVAVLILGIITGVLCLSFCAKETGFTTFYVEYAGEKYESGERKNISLFCGNTYTFFVKASEEKVEYEVEIESNSENNFLFTLNGKPCQFWNDDKIKDDYTKIFKVKKSAGQFTLTLPKDFTVEKAVEEKYGGKIEIKDELQEDEDYFEISVTAEKRKIKIGLIFRSMEIEMDPPSIII